MKIGRVAEAAGVAIQTIRFYERQGLLPDPPRQPSGYRMYSSDVIRRVVFIKRAKELGFSLKEIGELLCLHDHHNATAKEVKRIADKKLIDLNEKIRSLQRMQRALRRLVDDCPGHSGSKDCCSILGALSNDKQAERNAD